jgi:hypothetical protein
MSYSEEMAQNAEAGWFEVIANLERLLAPPEQRSQPPIHDVQAHPPLPGMLERPGNRGHDLESQRLP